MRNFIILSVCAVLLVFGAGSAQAASSVPRSTAAPKAHLSDAEIEHTIKTKLAKSKIGKDGFTVHVKGGVVTWEGSTNVIQHKGAATRMARTAGAGSVVNNIKISDEARNRAAGNLGGARRAQVKTN